VGLTKYFAFYNTERPHQALNIQTPQEVHKTSSGGGAMIVDKHRSKAQVFGRVIGGVCVIRWFFLLVELDQLVVHRVALAVKHGIESGLDEVQLVPKCFKDKSILMTHFFFL
jgi:hypothetical protein